MKRITFLIISVFLSLNFSFAEVYENLYLVGNATDVGWDPTLAIEMDKGEPGIFTWTGTLTDNTEDEGRFKFLVQRDWDPSITCRLDVDGHEVITSGVETNLFERTGGYDNAFQVAESGIYKIDIDLNTMKMTCTRLDDIDETKPSLKTLFIVGDATPAEWNNANAIQMSRTAVGVFSWTGELTGGKDFKFLSEKGSWNKTVNPEGADDVEFELETSYNLKYRQLETDPDDSKFKVTTTGTYIVTVDLNAMTLTVEESEPITPDLTKLYIIGNAMNEAGNWDFDNPEVMTMTSEGVFTWVGNLYNANGNQFKFLNEAQTWNTTINPKNSDITFVSGQTYDLYFRLLETSPNDYKFLVTTPGVYTIDVDLNTMQATITEGGNVGMEDAELDAFPQITILNKTVTMLADDNVQTVAIYDITGKCLNQLINVSNSVVLAENLTNGIYIVKLNCNGKETVQKIIVK